MEESIIFTASATLFLLELRRHYAEERLPTWELGKRIGKLETTTLNHSARSIFTIRPSRAHFLMYDILVSVTICVSQGVALLRYFENSRFTEWSEDNC